MSTAASEEWPSRPLPIHRRAGPPGHAPSGGTARAGAAPRSLRAGAAGLLLPCLLAWMPAALAQDDPAKPVRPAASETLPTGSVVRLLGREVTGPGGQVVAQVVNVLVDAAGLPRAAILDYGGFLGVGKRRIAVAWRALRFAPGQQAGAISLALGPDQLTNFPEFKPDGPLVVAAPPEAAPAPPEAAPAPLEAAPAPPEAAAPAAARD
ncbi:hypothetical protein ACFQS7_19135 [Dankookia sp. GCM10030260]|uniref:hypothetical protein n=1 Tax=Dankookia sp. GCM10030260 TaxID=3273390 RepID=UPI003618C49C